ncbi:Reverse transcriptase domain - like 10 [Theobroma cacao]|nr:Reverse transcriptase domain - like 10 [Theobroma cacao]
MIPTPCLSVATEMRVKQTVGKRCRAGLRLGKNLQGINRPLTLIKNEERFGLGYKPTKEERRKLAAQKKIKRMAQLEGKEEEFGKRTIPYLCETFRSAGFIHPEALTKVNQVLQMFDELSVHMIKDEESNEKEEKEILPHQELTEMINLGNGEEKREVKIGTSLSSNERQKLEELLREYVDVFAWSYQDMLGLNTDIVVHKLPLRPDCKPIKQKLRRMKPEMLLKIKEEVNKQFDTGFLEVAKYPEWVANILSIPKKDGKVRICVDYMDLNRASPKDSFPLPHIDTLVDNTVKHALFSFMDDFSSYNQIKMAPKDMEKMTFVTMWGMFCYKVMPFRLKNAGATYQRAMVALFHDMMHKETEVYVDDMIAKSHTERDHIVNLKKLFERL